ncbi:MAG: PA14 domain-containing protein [Phycisphaerales bacterium]|nr:PA14 domain-containing protein [Phycisphaerales bacterium]
MRTQTKRFHSPVVILTAGVLFCFSTSLHAEDCNGNGIDDAKDIASGTSLDCQPDGVPDECQTSDPFVYNYDVGTDTTLTSTASSTLLLTRYFSVGAFDIIGGVEVEAIGLPVEDFVVRAGLWLDTNGDGEPGDLVMVAEGTGAIGQSGAGRIPFQQAYELDGDGQSFFVGIWFNDLPGVEMGVDTSSLARQSWVALSGSEIDPEDLPGDIVRLGTICAGCNGDWAIRALGCDQPYCASSSDLDGNGIPDDCQEDCNGNGLPDNYEVDQGLATDCNDNGLLDECEGYGDCDGNGVIDICSVIPGSGLRATYWTNDEWSGVPDSFDVVPNMDFDSAVNPPDHGYDQNYSVRYIGVIHPPVSGIYSLRERSDDQFIMSINGNPVLGEGIGENSQYEFTAGEPVYMQADFNQGGGGHHLQVFWTPPGESEVVIPADVFSLAIDRDQDDQVDACVHGDCNGDGIDNLYELEVLGASDCNSDGVPDPCQWELDCDGNFLIDTCENGTGLAGAYYDSVEPSEFSRLVMTRVDSALDFNWGSDTPDERLGNDRFAIRWMGTLIATDVGGDYEIVGYDVDDGFRLWIDGELLIDEWHSSSGNDYSVTVNMAAGSRHEIRVDFYEDGGSAKVGLKWAPPGSKLDYVPTGNLLPMLDLDGDLIPDGCTSDCDWDGISDQVEIELGTALDCNENGVPDECDLEYFEENDVVAYWRFEVDSGLNHDSGPNNLQGTVGNASASADVPVSPVPRTNAENISSFDNGGVGRLEVVDDGSLSLIGTRFTAEAFVQLTELAPDATNNNSRQWLFMKKNPTSDGRIEWAVLVQGGNIADTCDRGVYGNLGPYTGRELVFLAAVGSESGSEKWCVVSDLEISDNDWHHISVGFDPNRNEVRFELDGVLDIQAFESNDTNPNSHPLCIAAHRNSTGGWNQQLKGRIDEVRIRRGLNTLDTMLDVPYDIVSEDVNGDGVPDECEGTNCPGDLNGDGQVQADDLGLLLAAWGPGSGPADLDGNGDVNGADLGLLFAAWGLCP